MDLPELEKKDDAESALAHVKETMDSLAQAKIKDDGWIKQHTAVLIASLCFIAGVFVGHWMTKL